MKNKGIYYTLAIIIVAGITITTCTNYFLRGSSKPKTNVAYEMEAPLDQDPVSGSDGGALSGGMSGIAEGKGPENRTADNLSPDSVSAGSMAEESITPEDAGAEETGLEAAMALAEDSADSSALGAGSEGAETESDIQSRMAVMTGSEMTSGNSAEGQNSGDAALQKSSASVQSADGAGSAAGPGNTDSGTDTESVSISPLETAAAESGLSSAPQNGASTGTAAAPVSYYRERLEELDAQIQKSRENQSASNINASAKNAASSELKLWDNELNLIYNEIMDRLNETQASALVKEEREWIKERDRMAAEAAKASSGGSLESVEYTVSLAETTRMRAYELVDTYEYLLMD